MRAEEEPSGATMLEAPPGHVCTIRGPAVTATLHYISLQFGESSLDRVLAALADEYRNLLDYDILLADADEHVVVPVRLLIALMERTGELCMTEAGGPGLLAERLGAFAAYEAQPLLRRFVINLSNPSILVRQASQIWGHYYNCGALKAEEIAERRVRLTVEGFHAAHPLWCRRLTGYFREALKRSSGRHVHMVETRCVTKGAPLCEWEGDWSGSSLY